MSWWRSRSNIQKLLIVFCAYGFLIDFKPSEPWITRFLRENKGLETEVIVNDVYPLWTYSYLSWVLVMGLLADGILSYKSIVLVGSGARLATRVLLLWGTSLLHIQATQVTFGLASASEITYYAYIYTLTSNNNYQLVTSVTRAAILVSHVASAFTGQVLHTQYEVPLQSLFYISFVSVIGAAIVSLAFPVPANSATTVEHTSHRKAPVSIATLKTTYSDLMNGYKLSPALRRWSIWWILGFAAHNFVLNYATALFDAVNPDVKWNGTVSGVARLAAAIGALAPAKFSMLSAAVRGEATAGVAAAVSAMALAAMTVIPSIYVAYACFIVYYGAFEVVVAVMATAVAAHTATHRYAAVFALNTLISLVLQSALQVILGKHVFALSVNAIFGVLTALVGLVSILAISSSCWLDRFKNRSPEEQAALDALSAPSDYKNSSSDKLPSSSSVELYWPWSRASPSSPIDDDNASEDTGLPAYTASHARIPLLSLGSH